MSECNRCPAEQRVVMAPICAEHHVVVTHCNREPCGNGFLAGTEMGRPFDETCHEQVVDTFLEDTCSPHGRIHVKPNRGIDFKVRVRNSNGVVAWHVGHGTSWDGRDRLSSAGLSVRLTFCSRSYISSIIED